MSMVVANKRVPLSKIIIIAVMILIAIACIYPLLLIIAISFTEHTSIYDYGYTIFPRKLSLEGYSAVWQSPTRLLNAYKITLATTAIGGVGSLLITAMLSYAIARKDFKFRGPISFLVFFTMLFNGGLVPWYMIITNVLHLKNTLWVLILPYIVNAWFVLLLRTFFADLPLEVFESAEIDGAGQLRTFFGIALPMSTPALAAVGFLIVLRYWNDWWLAYLFADQPKLQTLQYMIYSMISLISELSENYGGAGTNLVFPSESARMAMAILAAGPMLFVFPFFQKYFVKGITVGAVKG